MKRILGVIVGYVLWSVLWLCFNFALRKMGFLPESPTEALSDPKPLTMLLIASVLFSIVAGYATAMIAGAPWTGPVAALGALLLATGIFFQMQSWSLLPLWYNLIFLVLLVPMAFAGARLRTPAPA